MIICDHDQLTDEWFQERLGRPTVSMFDKIVTSTGQKSKSWNTAAYEKAAEIIAGKHEETFTSEWMQRGTDMEETAREAYQFLTDTTVIQVGVVFRDKHRRWSCSPDGIVLPNQKCKVKGGLEIKNPKMSTQAAYLHKKVLPTTYKPQVYGSLWICDELEYWDFFSYSPDMPHFLIRTDREDEGYKKYAEALDKYMPKFVEDVAKIVKEI